MIRYCTGNVFDQPADVYVVTVNCVGVMGAGIAKEAKERFPGIYAQYQNECKARLWQPGAINTYGAKVSTPPEARIATVCLMATKRHWRDHSQLEWVELGLQNLRSWLAPRPGLSVRMPPPGAGLGGLSYALVKALITDHLGYLDNPITVLSFSQGESVDRKENP